MHQPGCSKPVGLALQQVLLGLQLMLGKRHFWKILALMDDGFRSWSRQLLTKVDDIDIGVRCPVLVNLEPPKRYSSHQQWHSQAWAICNQTWMPETHLLVSFEVVWFMGHCYMERLQTRIWQQCLMDEEIRQTEQMGHLKPRDEVDPGVLFKDKQGCTKPFKAFVEGEWMYHTHGGVEETTPSGKVFCRGFHYFGCNATFVVL